MADDLSQQFFTSAKAQLDAAAKWQILVVIALLYFHFGIVLPFAEVSADKAGNDKELTEQRQRRDVIAPASDRTREFGDQVKAAVSASSDFLLAEKVRRFRKLNEAVSGLTNMSPEDAAGEPGAKLFEPPQPQIQMQQQPMPDTDDVALPPMSAELRTIVAQNQSSGELPLPLVAYIHDSIIQPAFDMANARLETQDLPAIETASEAALAAIAAAKLAATNAQLDAAAASVTALRDQIRAFRFVPPRGTEWWRSVASKVNSIRAMLAEVDRGIGDASRSHIDLSEIQAQTVATIAAGEQLSQKLEDDLDELEEKSKELQSKFTELGGPLAVITFKLSQLAPLLPLIVAAAIAGGSLWISQILRKMCLALALPIRSEQDSNMKVWLRNIAGGDRRRLLVREGLILALLLVWIGAAIWLTQKFETTLLPHTLTGALSVILVIGARAWLWQRNVLALEMTERPA
jgi:hypothetical protein